MACLAPPSLLLLALAAALLVSDCQALVSPDHFSPTPCKNYKLPNNYYGHKYRPPHKWCKPGHDNQGYCPARKVSVSYENLLRSNDSYPGLSGGSSTWGMMKDKDNLDVWRVLPSTAGVAFAPASASAGGYTFPANSGYGKFKSYSNAPDIPTLHLRGKDIYMVNHFEYNQPGNMYFTKLSQDKSTGKLSVKATEYVKDNVGTWFPCSGTITPWDSHLGSEEYPADCRVYEDTMLAATCTANSDFTACGWSVQDAFPADSALGMARLLGGQSMHPISSDDVVDKADPPIISFNNAMGFGSQTVLDDFRNVFNCYAYGSSPEVLIGNDGSYKLIKWHTLGRVSHESAIVMPDLKTVYTTDDGTNCGLYMFKADKAGDLSSGKLYAAKWTQAGAVDQFAITWILLGSSTQAALEAMIASKPKFSDIFETATPVKDTANFCPSGFKATNTPISKFLWPSSADPNAFYIECLKVKPGMETVAAFLETRRYAAMLGATTEFEKEEGLTFSKKHNELYIAYAKIGNGMIDSKKYSAGQVGSVNMLPNSCGAIFAFPMDSEYTATTAKAILYGKPLAAADADGNTCDINGLSGPDNVHYTNGILFIAEDTSSHLNNVLWAYDLDTKSLTRILSSPRGAEVTGIYISYIGDYAYLALGMQHPMDETPVEDITLAVALDQRSYLGYLGPLSASCLKAGKKPVFDGIPPATTPEQKKAVIATSGVTYV